MLHCAALSVHCGGRKNVEGGVMGDGRMLTPRTLNVHPGLPTSPSSTSSKTQSLPSAYSCDGPASGKVQQSTSHLRSSFRTEVPSQHETTSHHHKSKPLSPDEKKHRHFLGGLFHRKKKEEAVSDGNSSSSTNSDSDGFNPRKKLSKKNKKAPPVSCHSPPHKYKQQTRVTVSLAPNQSHSLPYFQPTVLHPSRQHPHTGSLGREYVHSPPNRYPSLGIPQLPLQYNHLKRLGASLSHDSLPASINSWNSESAYGSINSASARSSALGMGPRSSSIDTLPKRGRKDALKLRVERIRNKNKDSSSEDDQASISSHYGSESSLSISSAANKRSRSSRTEKYLRRKSYELETLRVESEKDQRNKEAVQARILEIQKSQRLKDKHKWSARLIYQESNEFDSVVLGTPQASPASSERVQARSLVEPLPHNAIIYNDAPAGISLSPPNSQMPTSPSGEPSTWGVFQECNSSGYGSIQGNRSISYDNMNKFPSLNHEPNHKIVNSVGQIAPVPPPREKGNILSPNEPIRPISYSFENLTSSAPQNFYKSCISPTPVMAKSNDYSSPPFSNGSINRSLSERQLCQLLNQTQVKPKKIPSRPTPPQGYQLSPTNSTYVEPSNGSHYNQRSSSDKLYSGNILPVTCVAPSPSSDYSSYRSENSPRMQPDNLNEQSIPKNACTAYGSSNFIAPKSYESNSSKIDEFVNMNAIPANVVPLNKKLASNLRPASSKVTSKMQNTKVEPSVDRETPSKVKPEPPKRGSSSLTRNNREYLKKQLRAMEDESKDFKLRQEERRNMLENLYQQEKAKLQKNKCANFEEALQELEEIYKSLNLDSEDIMEGAEKRDISIYHQDQWKENSQARDMSGVTSDDTLHDRSRSRTPAPRRSDTPDKKMDDLHFRRCQLSNRSTPDTKKPVQCPGSYLLVSPAHVMPNDIGSEGITDTSKGTSSNKEPDIIFDDFLYRNIQRANAVKVIDPQPPFGIPLGPVTQASSTDYLHSIVDENVSRSQSREPDIVTDDLAFRNLRKDNLSQSNKALNTSQLDEIIIEAANATKRHVRSASADRSIYYLNSSPKKVETHTPRKVKYHSKVKKAGRFYNKYKEAITDSESASCSQGLERNKPSWVERANLDNRWGSCNTSTETLTESSRAVSQPNIRHAIINESKNRSGGPETQFNEDDDEHPKLVKIQSVPNPSEMHRRKPYRPLDVIFNNKPKPFYLSGNKGQETSKVDVTKLDDIISTFGKLDQDVPSHLYSTSQENPPLDTSQVDHLKNFDTKTSNKNEGLRILSEWLHKNVLHENCRGLQ